VDRLGREIIVQAIAERDLTRHGARIEYVLGGGNATPEQELLKMMKQGIAVYENRQRVERSRRGKDGRVRAGGVLVAARPAYGYRYVSGDHTGTLEPHPDEAPIVQQIFAWCVDERLSCYAIAKRLCETGRPSRADTDTGVVRKRAPHHTWNPHTVAKMLRNETYMGVWHWGKTRRVKRGDRIVQEPRPREEWLSLPVPALVDETTWQRAQVQLGRNKANARMTDREYLLRGLIFCPSCGRRWYARYKRDIDRCYYRCPSARRTVGAIRLRDPL